LKLLDKIWSVLGLVETEETELQSEPEKPAEPMERKADRADRKPEKNALPLSRQLPVMQPLSNSPVVKTVSPTKQAPQNAGGSPTVVISHPVGFDDAMQIADHVTGNRIVVVNFAKTDSENTKRTVDFMSGITYAVGGVVQRISGNIFMFAPDSVDIAMGDSMKDEGIGSISWTRQKS